MFDWFRSRSKDASRPKPLTVDDWGVRRRLSDGSLEEQSWESLQSVVVVTTDEGPLGDDVIVLLVGPDGKGCAVPQGTPGDSALLRRLQQLPEFDNEQFIRAMSCCEPMQFLCWQRKDGA